MHSSRHIVITGGRGSGKTTLLNEIRDRLMSAGLPKRLQQEYLSRITVGPSQDVHIRKEKEYNAKNKL